MALQNVKLIISYDGTRFFGWQKTRTGPSIQEELEKAASCLLGAPTLLEAASRTDRGVHAKAQAVHFLTEKPVNPRRLLRGFNALLPPEISVRSIELASKSFHPTLDAAGKEYHYFLCNGPVQAPTDRLYSWHFLLPLDLEKMNRAAQNLIGTHDFAAFANEQEDADLLDTVRTIERAAIIPLENNRLRIEIRGDRFLYKMARNLAGTLTYIGCGKLHESAIPELLASRDRKKAGMTAPAHGLFLAEVFYPWTRENSAVQGPR